MNLFHAKTIVLTATMLLQHSPEEIFPLLCPVKEYDWIEHWKCDLLYSESGVNELGCIFRTAFPEQEEEVWVTSRWEPSSRVEFVRNGANKVILFSIALEPTDAGTKLVWSQKLIGITEKGNAMIEAANPEEFSNMVAALENMIDYYLKHGAMYRETGAQEDSHR